MVPVVKTGLSSGKSRICPFCGTNVDPFGEYFLIGIIIFVFILFLASKLLPEKHTTQSTPETKTESTVNPETKTGNIPVKTSQETPTAELSSTPTSGQHQVNMTSSLYKLGHEKGQLLAKELFTDNRLLVIEKCNQAMIDSNSPGDEYMIGCLEGFDPKGKLSPQTNEASSKANESPMQTKSKAPSSYTSTDTDRTRKGLEREEIRRKRDALQPMLREGCLQGNQEACRQYKEWENIR